MSKRLLALPVVLTAAVGLSALPASGAGTSVAVKDNFFSPKTKTIAKNTIVTFRWSGIAPHNVVAKSPVAFNSGIKRTGTYRRKFTRTGTYRIVCTIHQGMKMTLTVK